MYHILKKSLLPMGLLLSINSPAAVSQQLTVTTTVTPSSIANKLEINATFDMRGMGQKSLADESHPAKIIYDRIVRSLSSFGEVTSGLETGENRQSVRVLVDSIRDSTGVTGADGSQPALLANISKIHKMLDPIRSDLETLGRFQLGSKHRNPPYVELKYPTSRDIDKFILCVSLDYQASVLGSLKLPDHVSSIMRQECKEEAAAVDLLELSTTLEKQVLQLVDHSGDPSFMWEDYPEYWLPSAFSSSFSLCEDPLNFDALIKAGWISELIPMGARKNECTKFLQKMAVSTLDQAVTSGMTSNVLKKSINPYYRSLLKALLEKSGSRHLVKAEDVHASVDKVLGSQFTISEGFTKSELKTADFNTGEFLAAVQQDPESDPSTLLVLLLSAPKPENGKEFPATGIRQELSQAMADGNSAETKAYIERMKAALARICSQDQLNPSCIYAGATKINGSLIKLEIRSGLGAKPTWEGFYLMDPRRKEEP
jgi:hypothetical protein